MSEPTFPPLLSGQAVEVVIDPFDKACALALQGCDGGKTVYNLAPSILKAAIVFAPDVPLQDAMAMVPVCGIGFQNALGALAPPEVAVHLEWAGGIRINGATCGRLRASSSDTDPLAVPDWMVVGFELPLWPQSDDPGKTPDQTALYAEGCADVDAVGLLESWARHTLSGVVRWGDGGLANLHREWRGLAHGIGEEITIEGKTGTFVGVDERFGMLLRTGSKTELIPLSVVLEYD